MNAVKKVFQGLLALALAALLIMMCNAMFNTARAANVGTNPNWVVAGAGKTAPSYRLDGDNKRGPLDYYVAKAGQPCDCKSLRIDEPTERPFSFETYCRLPKMQQTIARCVEK